MNAYNYYIIAAYGITIALGAVLTIVSWYRYQQSRKNLPPKRKNHAEK